MTSFYFSVKYPFKPFTLDIKGNGASGINHKLENNHYYCNLVWPFWLQKTHLTFKAELCNYCNRNVIKHNHKEHILTSLGWAKLPKCHCFVSDWSECFVKNFHKNKTSYIFYIKNTLYDKIWNNIITWQNINVHLTQ